MVIYSFLNSNNPGFQRSVSNLRLLWAIGERFPRLFTSKDRLSVRRVQGISDIFYVCFLCGFDKVRALCHLAEVFQPCEESFNAFWFERLSLRRIVLFFAFIDFE